MILFSFRNQPFERTFVLIDYSFESGPPGPRGGPMCL